VRHGPADPARLGAPLQRRGDCGPGRDLPRRNGPKPRLSPGQEAVAAGWAEQGPDLARDGVVRWRCRDLRNRIEREFAVGLHERTVGKLLAKLAFRRLSVRPQHPRSDPAAQAVFRVGSPVS
jgi:transposase